jgi:hypothetical protein
MEADFSPVMIGTISPQKNEKMDQQNHNCNHDYNHADDDDD